MKTKTRAVSKRGPGRPLKGWNSWAEFDAQLSEDLRKVMNGSYRMSRRLLLLETGHKELVQRIDKRGGVRQCSELFGFLPPIGHGSKWTEQRMEDELRKFVGSRSQMPVEKEFIEKDKGTLLEEMKRYAPENYWTRLLKIRKSRKPHRLDPQALSLLRSRQLRARDNALPNE